MLTRRAFLRQSAVSIAAFGMPSIGARLGATETDPHPFQKTIVAGTPVQRGRRYGELFKEGIHSFLEKEIYRPFIGAASSKDALLRYADACRKEVERYAPTIHEELGGMAEGSGLRMEELMLITLHEELYHKGILPKIPHCTAAAAGPPETTGATYVGQTWDWMPSVYGLSSILLWQRPEGCDVLAYAFPGLWVGAGLNSAGLALCWTSADLGDHGIAGARVGIPSYLLLTHFLYQESLEAVIDEAQRATNAGWFTFVMADGDGELLNIEGSPKEIVCEKHRRRLARVGFGSRRMTRTEYPAVVSHQGRCKRMYDLLAESSGKIDAKIFQRWYEDPGCGISEKGTIDMMIFDTTARAAYVSRGPHYHVAWQQFGFDEAS